MVAVEGVVMMAVVVVVADDVDLFAVVVYKSPSSLVVDVDWSDSIGAVVAVAAGKEQRQMMIGAGWGDVYHDCLDDCGPHDHDDVH